MSFDHRPLLAAAALCLGLAAAPAVAANDCAAAPERADCLTAVYRGPSSQWPAPQIDAGQRWQELAPRQALPAQPPALAALGRQLFFEPQLSRARDISCASCHAPHLGFADARRLALGHEGTQGPRHTPHLLGVAHASSLMWDGRAADLEAQAMLPIVNPIEMAMDLPALLQRLNRETDYPGRFRAVFGDAAITVQRLSAALASFQRGIEAPRSRFDDFIEGRKPDALNDQELRGLHLFRTQARCMNCHSGPQLTQHEFHQIGFSFLGRRQQDLGRQAVTGKAEDMGSLRTPSLRGLSRTAPYMHNGALPTLRSVIEMYNAGMQQPPKREPPLPGPSPLIKPLKLSVQEMRDLEAFLKTL
jgi:cytochrome c peroxidase